MGEMNLSEIKNKLSIQITEIKEEIKNTEIKRSDPRTKTMVNSIIQSSRVLLDLDKKSITSKLNKDLETLSLEIEKLKKDAVPDVTVLRSVLAVFEALQEDLKVMKDDPESLKRGERVEKVENERFDS